MTWCVARGLTAPDTPARHGISSRFAGRTLAHHAKEANMTRLTLTLAALAVATPALALEPINQEAYINDTLLQGFIGDAIDDNCPTIEARTLRALGELNKLRDYALEKGYTAAEVRAFVTDKAEKARGKALAAEWLKARGAEPGNPEAYCAIGEAEIAKGSLIGYLLRSTR
jgi:hypothetical protein